MSRYNGPGNSVDDAVAIGVSPDGTKVFVTGSSWDVSRDFATVAYDASSGTQVWVSRYDGPAASYDDAWDLSVSPDGSRVFVTGDSDGVGTSYDFATIAYDATAGAEQWVARYSSGTNAVDEAYGVRPSPDGGTVFVTGWSDAGAGRVGYATLAYDAITGTQTGLELASNGQASMVRVSPDGSTVFVTGSQGGTVNATTKLRNHRLPRHALSDRGSRRPYRARSSAAARNSSTRRVSSAAASASYDGRLESAK